MNIETASLTELRTYAADELGIELPAKISQENALKKIEQAIGVAQTAKTDNGKNVDERIKIIIHKTENPNEVDPVFVGVNAKGYTIKRGVEVEVPSAIVEVLDHAMKDTYHSVPNDRGGMDIEKRTSRAYPYQILG